uniref:Uncharacterized protein n=1 Tax=Arundo donax TaxID=35708 RepID=A0A0A9B8L4_ARUDO
MNGGSTIGPSALHFIPRRGEFWRWFD